MISNLIQKGSVNKANQSLMKMYKINKNSQVNSKKTLIKSFQGGELFQRKTSLQRKTNLNKITLSSNIMVITELNIINNNLVNLKNKLNLTNKFYKN